MQVLILNDTFATRLLNGPVSHRLWYMPAASWSVMKSEKAAPVVTRTNLRASGPVPADSRE